MDVMFSLLSVCLLAGLWEKFSSDLMTSCNIMDEFRREQPFNFGFDSTQNGLMAVILDFCYDILHIDTMQSNDK